MTEISYDSFRKMMKAVGADYSREAFDIAQKAVQRTPSKKGKKRDRSRTRSPARSESDEDVVLVEKAKAQGVKEAELSFRQSQQRLARTLQEVKGTLANCSDMPGVCCCIDARSLVLRKSVCVD